MRLFTNREEHNFTNKSPVVSSICILFYHKHSHDKLFQFFSTSNNMFRNNWATEDEDDWFDATNWLARLMEWKGMEKYWMTLLLVGFVCSRPLRWTLSLVCARYPGMSFIWIWGRLPVLPSSYNHNKSLFFRNGEWRWVFLFVIYCNRFLTFAPRNQQNRRSVKGGKGKDLTLAQRQEIREGECETRVWK